MRVLFKYPKFFPFFLLFLLSFSVLVSAAQTQINIPSEISSLTIVYPKVLYLPKEKEVNLSFDILDGNLSRRVTPEVNCSYFVVNNRGLGIVNGDLNYGYLLGYWYFQLNATHTNTTGDYNFYVHCNSSFNEYGYISSTYTVTTTGKVEVDTTEILIGRNESILLFFILALSIVLLLLGVWKEDINVVSLSGILFIICGVYILIYGFEQFTNLLNTTLGIVLIGFGAYVSVAPHLEHWSEIF